MYCGEYKSHEQWSLTFRCPFWLELWTNVRPAGCGPWWESAQASRWCGVSCKESWDWPRVCPCCRTAAMCIRLYEAAALLRSERKHFTTLNTLGLQNQLKSLFCNAAYSYALMFETQVCTLTSLTCWASRMTLWFRMWLKSSGSVETEAFGALSATDTICTGTTCVWLTNSYYCLKVWLSKFFLFLLKDMNTFSQ